MSGIWNRTLVYLGLREEPDETQDDLPARFVPEDDPHAEHAQARPAMAGAAVGGSMRRDGTNGSTRTESVAASSAVPADLGERPSAARDRSSETPDNVLSLRAGDVHVRAVPTTSSRAAVVEVHVFDDVEAVGARYRTGQPVLMDASATDTATARRIVDFVSGLTYALRGEMTKVGVRSFLVVPAGVALRADERRRLSDLGYRLPTGSDT